MQIIRQFDKPHLPEAAIFAGCSAREHRSLSRLGTTVRVRPGTTLTPEGRPGKEFFVIKDGAATCTFRGSELAHLSNGDFFGEMALLDGGPRTATVIAETPLDLVVYSTVEFRTMVDTSSRIRRHLLTEMAHRLRAADAEVSRVVEIAGEF